MNDCKDAGRLIRAVAEGTKFYFSLSSCLRGYMFFATLLIPDADAAGFFNSLQALLMRA